MRVAQVMTRDPNTRHEHEDLDVAARPTTIATHGGAAGAEPQHAE